MEKSDSPVKLSLIPIIFAVYIKNSMQRRIISSSLGDYIDDHNILKSMVLRTIY